LLLECTLLDKAGFALFSRGIGRRKKIKQMVWCLAEAARRADRIYLRRAQSVSIMQDGRKNKLLVRFRASDHTLFPRFTDATAKAHQVTRKLNPGLLHQEEHFLCGTLYLARASGVDFSVNEIRQWKPIGFHEHIPPAKSWLALLCSIG
jgi:hypothetical protein